MRWSPEFLDTLKAIGLLVLASWLAYYCYANPNRQHTQTSMYPELSD